MRLERDVLEDPPATILVPKDVYKNGVSGTEGDGEGR